MSASDGSDGEITRSGFSTTDPARAEQFFRDSYADLRLRFTGRPEDFTVDQLAVTGPGLVVSTLQIGIDLTYAIDQMLDDVLVMSSPFTGRLTYAETCYQDTCVTRGEVALSPPTGPAVAASEQLGAAVVVLDRARVARHAAAMVGIEPDQLRFDRITPADPRMARFWTGTVAHVRDDVLINPWVVAEPILANQAFRTLATGLLSTIPNSALARAVDPETPPVHGDLPEATLREVAEYIDAHADRPLGPTDIVGLTGRSTRDVGEGLRRSRGKHPSELLWDARLRGARRALEQAAPETAPDIAALARRWGFGDLGRFRVAYTRAFGEPPEETLRR
ncbi:MULTISPECIES: helix-turn-helix domain-containing protein [unclassified Pseudonocardia]|uniref:AraC family transcriptional regulator n=1 Tax=unclassified Pseudonocardia TaxID=2619320 RepID=UPI0001FFDD62|nr:helix-turn-helix domain-containing protein [Pseudonocardia sp. Ae707_Ps1]OLM20804.1 transcriptional regulator, AraC family protein [Pseudonocardia sp. Ae707_Ps1]